MTKLAWWLDWGVDPAKSWWADQFDGQKLKILEVGCGNGGQLAILRSLGHDVTGIEPDPQAARLARDAGFTVHDGTAEDLPADLARDRFDVVVFMHVLEHCADPTAAIENALTLLRPGGRVVAEVPNNACRGAARFGIFWSWLDVPRHLNFFTCESLCELLTSAGLTVDDICYRGFTRQFAAHRKADQRRIAATLGKARDARVGTWSYWAYLLETGFAKSSRKYDSVRVQARLA